MTTGASAPNNKKDKIVNRIEIDVEYDTDGQEIENSYVITLIGDCAYEMDWDTEYSESDVDAYEIAKEAQEETGAEIIWKTMKPSWA